MSEGSRLERSDVAVVLEEVATRSGHVLGVATLNSEKTLNALSLPMIESLAPAIRDWGTRADVVAVLLQGAGDRAFCAGGDIQALYRSMLRNREAGRRVDPYAESFFEAEYRLDYRLHTCPKPIVCFGHGVVMGGGLGLYSASRFRLVTETSRIAMPEVTIGLFPDAGASWILKHLPIHEALYLGATGSHMNGADALHIGLATHAVAAAAWPSIREAFVALDWRGDSSDGARIDRCLRAFDRAAGESQLVRYADPIRRALDAFPASPQALTQRIGRLAGQGEWLDRAIATMARGCPTSVGIVLEQLRRLPALELADCFRLELTIATHCARNADFVEGVRALIIDKDNAPRWRFGSLDALSADYVSSHFAPPWPVNPLSDLEGSK